MRPETAYQIISDALLSKFTMKKLFGAIQQPKVLRAISAMIRTNIRTENYDNCWWKTDFEKSMDVILSNIISDSELKFEFRYLGELCTDLFYYSDRWNAPHRMATLYAVAFSNHTHNEMAYGIYANRYFQLLEMTNDEFISRGINLKLKPNNNSYPAIPTSYDMFTFACDGETNVFSILELSNKSIYTYKGVSFEIEYGFGVYLEQFEQAMQKIKELTETD